MTPIAATTVAGADVKFGDDVPELVRAEILKCWPHLVWLIPRWCRSVTFYWQPTASDDESAACSPDYTYGYVSITVTGNWIDDRGQVMLRDLCHEFVHLWIQPVAGYAKETFETLLKQEAPKFHATVEKELNHRVEVAVQDMAYALTERFLLKEQG